MGKRVEKAKEKTEKGNAGVEEQLSKTAGNSKLVDVSIVVQSLATVVL